MITYPNISPIAISIGPLDIRWYGITYLLGLAVGWALGRYRLSTKKYLNITPTEFSDLLLSVAIGLLLGGRLGYMLFYKTTVLFTAPWEVFMIRQGGMSFHGGLIGVIIAMLWFCRQNKLNFFAVTDFVAPLAPPAFLFGRIGNFINGELWGKVTDVPWGMVFPYAGDLPRHPTQLYEGFLEGIVLFLILWVYTLKPRPRMATSGLFMICYGLFRWIVEFFRMPDSHLGYIAFDWLTMGQLLSLPMVAVGIILIIKAYQEK
ncbi:MAG: prolipoprotein diacylglyceryl transferase [Burkholderiales bacterium]|nr:prolipoprotein diacylglyceryl transferase [Burkholderiales bacterium]